MTTWGDVKLKCSACKKEKEIGYRRKAIECLEKALQDNTVGKEVASGRCSSTEDSAEGNSKLTNLLLLYNILLVR